MDMINVIGGLLYQWDTGRKVKIMSPSCISVDEVHFTNDMQDALVVEPKIEDNVYYAEIPNILLQDKRDIKVYVVMRTESGEQTMFSRGLTVNPRQKPSDYVYTETEVKSYEKLDQRIKALEGTTVLTTPQELTDEERARARANIGVAQADLSVNDPTDPRHVLNRTHWEEGGLVEIPVTGQWDESENVFVVTAPVDLEVGKTYIVNWNGTEYTCVAQDMGAVNAELSGMIGVGNLHILFPSLVPDTGEPFVIAYYAMDMGGGQYGVIGSPTDGPNIPFSIYRDGATVHKLDNKYLNLDWLPTIEEKDIFPETAVACTENVSGNDNYFCNIDTAIDVTIGQNVVVYLNGVRYVCEVEGYEKPYYVTVNGIVTILVYTSSISVVSTVQTEYTLRICESSANKLPEEYLPESVGKVKTVNGIAPDEDGNVEIEVSASGDSIPVPQTASVGQVISVKAVDENGKPTEWECVDRTHYEVEKEAVLIDADLESYSTMSNNGIDFPEEITLVAGRSYTLYVNGENKGTSVCQDPTQGVRYGSGYDSYGIMPERISHFAGEGTFRIKIVEQYKEIKQLDEKFLPKATAVTDVTAAPTADDFNALLVALREAGYLAT